MSSIITRRCIGLIIVIMVSIITFSAPFQNLASFPNEIRMFAGQQLHVAAAIPALTQLSGHNPDVINIKGNDAHSYLFQSGHTGITETKLKLFGTIPFKTVKVKVLDELLVIPGGQTIGVKIKAAGILVVGHHIVTDLQNVKRSPGELANVQIGDLITKFNGKMIRDVTQVAELVNRAGKTQKPLVLTIIRNKQEIALELMPVYDKMENSYRLGLYIRDSAAGVGTLTFYAPEHRVYGALGHVITDMDTQSPIAVGGGEIVHSNVTSISKSQNGEPGEKRAHFFNESKVLGNIKQNTSFGIFGTMFEEPDHALGKQAIPVALAEEVKEGPAEIYTVVNGQKVEKFSIEVVHAAKQMQPATKGMIIKVTDSRLLEKTGGIVQGMSGSPIIQNGKLIGAVTHVFVNDPTSGYGCYIEWMLKDAGINLLNPNTSSTEPSAKSA